jgi:hypothetical protein
MDTKHVNFFSKILQFIFFVSPGKINNQMNPGRFTKTNATLLL